MPFVTAMVSPCCSRALLISMLPPAAWISRKRSGHGFGLKSFRPRSTAVMSASSGISITWCNVGATADFVLSATSITGLLVAEPSSMRPPISRRAALNSRLRSAAARALHHRLVEHHRDLLGRGRQAAHLALCALPVGGDGGGLAGIGDGQRAGDLGGQQRRLPDLRGNQNVLGLDRERLRGGFQLKPRIGAAHLEPQRKSAHGLRAAGVDSSGLGLALAPAGDHGFGAAGRVVPERAPPSGDDNGQSDQDQRPAAPGQFFVHGTCEAAECGVSKMTLSGLCAAMSSPVAAAAAA